MCGIKQKTLEEISYEAERLNASFLIGGDRPVDLNYFENYGIFINENGEIAGEYLKQHPVPFGEYIPFRRYLDWIPPLSLVPRDMIRGEGQEIFELGQKNIKISSVISFEGSFERYIRRSVQGGAELIFILTNQASYGESGMSDQFILMSRANAVSNHRDVDSIMCNMLELQPNDLPWINPNKHEEKWEKLMNNLRLVIGKIEYESKRKTRTVH